MANHRPGQSVHWRRDPVILARLVEVERRQWRRQPNTLIAAALGVSENTIRQDKQRLQALWRERVGTTQDEKRAEIIAELDDTARLAQEAYEFDLAAETAVLYGRAPDGPDGQPRIVYRDDKGGASFKGGKAQALNVRRQAVMDKAKVLGVVVDKVAPTKADGTDLDLATLVAKARANRAERESRGEPDADA